MMAITTSNSTRVNALLRNGVRADQHRYTSSTGHRAAGNPLPTRPHGENNIVIKTWVGLILFQFQYDRWVVSIRDKRPEK